MNNTSFVSLLRRCVFGAAFSAAFACSVAAAPKLKLGTLVPVGTSYHKTLMTMAETWRKESAGATDLNIFAGGKLGGEAEMVGLMQTNNLQAALLTGVGLAEIEPGVTGLQNIPMGFRTLAEVDYVGEHLRPLLEERLAKRGFVVLFWVDSGWVRFFAKQPIERPDDLRKLKLFSWSGNPAQVELYQSAGFDAKALETDNILPGLQTGLIDAVPLPPFFAMAMRADERAPHMLELNWAPLIGALVVRKESWEKIPEATRAKLMESARTAGAEIKATGRREMDESVAAMEKRGLKVQKVSPEIEAEWRAISEQVYPKIRGKLVPADIFDEALRLLAECRAQGKS
ncbi:MAG TPA: TRAP transporter substrate-binding protein DctP [Opitutaceae bacterium]|nr:TRAP transporter substrate-binding protein DctP [Opitutaceae bacterium]